MKKYVSIDGKVSHLVKIFLLLFSVLSGLLILSCCMTTETVKHNIEKSAFKMEQEGCYPQYLVTNRFYQLDNFTEAEVLNFIYSNYEGNPIKTAFAQRSIGGYYKGVNAETSFERLIACVSSKDEIDESVRPSYWIGARIFLIPLLNFMDYYQIRSLFFGISCLVLLGTVILICRKESKKLGLGLLVTFVLINFPIAFLNNSLGMLCMCLTLLSIVFFIYHKNVSLTEFMFIVGMMTVYFEWFSLSIFSFGMIACVILVQQYLEQPNTPFVVFFNKIWNAAIGWGLGVASMFLGRLLINLAMGNISAFDHFLGRLTTNTGIQSEGNVIVKMVLSIICCICGVFPIPVVIQTKNWILVGLMVLVLAISGIALLVAIKKKSKNWGFSVSMLIVASSPIVWIAVFNTYFYVHYWIAYRILGISIFALICIILFGLDWRKTISG